MSALSYLLLNIIEHISAKEADQKLAETKSRAKIEYLMNIQQMKRMITLLPHKCGTCK